MREAPPVNSQDHWEAWEALYKKHYSEFLKSALRLTGDMEMAKDTVQDAFINCTKQSRKEGGEAVIKREYMHSAITSTAMRRI